MGYHCDNIYIGPAIRIKPQKKLMSVAIDSCSDDSCEKSRIPVQTKFCTECGSPVLPRAIQKSYAVSFHDFTPDPSGSYKKYEDDLFNPNYDKDGIWIPNRQVKDMCAFTGDIDERTITIGEKFPENKARQLTIFEGYYDQMFKDMREFGLVFETVYVIKTYGF